MNYPKWLNTIKRVSQLPDVPTLAEAGVANADLICQLGETAHRHTGLRLEKRAEHFGPPILEVAVPLQSTL